MKRKEANKTFYRSLLLIFLIGSHPSYAQAPEISLPHYEIPDESFKIIRITNNKSYNVIYAQRNDSIFEEVSKQQNALKIPCEKMKLIFGPCTIAGFMYGYDSI